MSSSSQIIADRKYVSEHRPYLDTYRLEQAVWDILGSPEDHKEEMKSIDSIAEKIT